MEFLKLVETRRSVRSYAKASVEAKDLESAVKTALMAPSWKNSETARYYFANGEENA